MALSIIGALVAAAVGLGGLWIRHRELADGESRRILRDIEIFSSLPESSGARTGLGQAIDEAVSTMLTNRTTRKRNGTNIGIGLFLLALTFGIGLVAIRGGWWLTITPIAFFTLTFGVYGTIEGSIRSERDARGNVARSTNNSRSRRNGRK